MHQQSSPFPPQSPESSEPPDLLEPAEAVAVDVSDRSLLELLQDPGSELAESTRKLVTEHHHRQPTMSSFSNFVA